MKEETFLSRTELLLGRDKVAELAEKTVAVFGIGGVGGHATDALARSGIGHLVLVDSDQVAPSNINRQLIATTKTIGRDKVEVMKEHILDINPLAEVETHCCFYLPETAAEFDFSQYDYVVDAVDTVTAKLGIITQAKEAGVPVISSMGAGNKLDPARFEVADISQTSVCPLAKVMRYELRKRGITGLKVVYSKEVPRKPAGMEEETEQKGRSAPGSIAFVPSVAGLILASEVVKDLLNLSCS